MSKNYKFNIGNDGLDDDFIMSPKVDFVFKLIFGDEKNKDVLIAFLSAALQLPKEEFIEIELLNTELLREFKEDKKGILDIRVNMDQLTREKSAEEKGRQEEKIIIAKNLIGLLDDETIAIKTGLSIDIVKGLKN